MAKTIVITGGTGFIGGAAIQALLTQGYNVVALSRGTNTPQTHDRLQWVQTDYSDQKALEDILTDAHTVIHLADNPNRLAHDTDAGRSELTLVLSRAMRNTMVPRVILASSVYARFAQDENTDAYGQHKLRIEQTIAQSGLEAVILRLPPVYGPGAGGGISILAKLIRKNLPLPIGRARAERAYLAIDNLTDLFSRLIAADDETWHRNAGRIYEPADSDPVSTVALVYHMIALLGSSSRIVAVPSGWLNLLARLTGKSETVSAAFSPLVVRKDPDLFADFGWQARLSMPETLRYLTANKDD